MTYCNNCGAKILPNLDYCISCDEKIISTEEKRIEDRTNNNISSTNTENIRNTITDDVAKKSNNENGTIGTTNNKEKVISDGLKNYNLFGNFQEQFNDYKELFAINLETKRVSELDVELLEFLTTVMGYLLSRQIYFLKIYIDSSFFYKTSVVEMNKYEIDLVFYLGDKDSLSYGKLLTYCYDSLEHK